MLIEVLDHVMCVEYIFAITRGSIAPPIDYGTIAVIDGKSLKVTPLRIANIPPPMALFDITLPKNISDAAIDDESKLIAVLHQEGISVYTWENSSASSQPALKSFHYFEDIMPKSAVLQICFAEKGSLVVWKVSEKEEPSLLHFHLAAGNNEMEQTALETVGQSEILMISSFMQGGKVCAYSQGISGDLRQISLGSQSKILSSFPFFLPWVKVACNGDDLIAFGLSANGQLYANLRLLVKNCTSFLVTPLHLIFITTTHLLKFVHITKVEGKSLHIFSKLF